MDDVVADKHKNMAIKQISAHLLYLGVTLLSDIVTADGSSIQPEMMQGNPSPYHRHTGLMPYQDSKPGPKAWTQWRKASHTQPVQGTTKLKYPLG